MPKLKKDDILSELDSLIEEAKRLDNSFRDPGGYTGKQSQISEHEHRSFAVSALSTIERIAGRDSQFYESAPDPSPDERLTVLGMGDPSTASVLRGVLMSLRRAVQNDLLYSLESRLRASIHDDFLEQASDLIDQDYHVAAMVQVGAVLENHLREMCAERDIAWEGGGSISAYNDALYEEDVFRKTTWRRIQAVGDDRNDAAHGHFEKIDESDVADHLDYVRRILSEYSG